MEQSETMGSAMKTEKKMHGVMDQAGKGDNLSPLNTDISYWLHYLTCMYVCLLITEVCKLHTYVLSVG